MRNGFLDNRSPFQRLLQGVDNPDNYLIHFMDSPHIQMEDTSGAGADETITQATGGKITNPGALDKYASTLPPEPTAEATPDENPMAGRIANSRRQRMMQQQQNPGGLGKIIGRSGDNRFV